jgi:hypothetical protein
MTGQGGAVLDYDGDGDLDVYLVQGAALGGAASDGSASDLLFRNDLTWDEDGVPRLQMIDVTESSGIEARGYGMGATVGDVDSDGDLDLYVTNFGSNQLLRNNGDGTFDDVTLSAGADDPGWSTSATFFDYDRDGQLDLYVANYVEFDLVRNPTCYSTSSRRDYCGPSGFAPQADRLLRNVGGGRFEDVTLRVLPGYAAGPGLGVIAADLDDDGWLDLYVANDGEPNQLWINHRDGTFRDQSLLAGVAVNREGRAEASMGVDAADVDGDGDEDLFLTHLAGETSTLYVNRGGGVFEDRSIASGVAGPTFPYTAFGTGWLDFDNDGWLDLVVLNGAVRVLEERAATGDPFPLGQPNQLFQGVGDGDLIEVTERAGDAFAQLEVSRGAALGDVDNDGDEDVVQFNNNDAVRLLINQVGEHSGWIGLRTVDSTSGGELTGSRVAATLVDGRQVVRRSRRDGSYCSARDARVLLGVAAERSVRQVEIRWPSGARTRWLDPPLDAYLTALRAESD